MLVKIYSKIKSFFLTEINFKNAIIYSIQYGSLSIILLALNALHQEELVTSIALIQSAIYIVTIGLSANLRSLCLSKQLLYLSIFKLRLYISLTALVFFTVLLYWSNVNFFVFTLLLVLRKLFDWIDEILVLNSTNENKKIIYIIAQLVFLTGFPILILFDMTKSIYYLLIWNLVMVFIMKGSYLELVKHFRFNYNESRIFSMVASSYPNILATLIPTLSNYSYRANIIEIFDPKKASNLMMSLSLSGIISSFFIFIFIPELVNNFRKHKNVTYLITYFSFIVFLYFLIYFYSYEYKAELNHLNFNYKFIFFGCIAGFLAVIASFMRIYQIQKFKIATFTEEVITGSTAFSMILLGPVNASTSYYAVLPICVAAISIVIYDVNNSFTDITIKLRKLLYIFLYIALLLSATLISINHDFSSNLETINLKITSLGVFLIMIFFVNKLVKKVTKNNSNFKSDLLIIMLWFLFISRYLEVFDVNYFTSLFFICTFVLQYLFYSISKFINIGFLRNYLRAYLIIITSYLAF